MNNEVSNCTNRVHKETEGQWWLIKVRSLQARRTMRHSKKYPWAHAKHEGISTMQDSEKQVLAHSLAKRILWFPRSSRDTKFTTMGFDNNELRQQWTFVQLNKRKLCEDCSPQGEECQSWLRGTGDDALAVDIGTNQNHQRTRKKSIHDCLTFRLRQFTMLSQIIK